jgi:dTDP-4-amino-4,6-dideoxygalactose transaminase
MFFYYPPAKSDVFLMNSLLDFFFVDNVNFNMEIAVNTGNKKVVTNNSWVGILTNLFRVLSTTKPQKKYVVLSRHSCYEFSDAIYNAGLLPIYIDVDNRNEMDIDGLIAVEFENVLCVINICNLAQYSKIFEVKRIAKFYDVFFIEDATYTLMGSINGVDAGSWGDFVIYNFSEGKSIPIGGGGVGTNNSIYADTYLRELEMLSSGANSFLNELVSIIRYIVGSSLIGYSIYRLMLTLFNKDLKRIYSMEPARRGNKEIRFTEQKNIGKLKSSIGIKVLQNKNVIINLRYAKYVYLMKRFRDLRIDILSPISYELGQMVIKVPVILENLDYLTQERFRKVGVIPLYSASSPLYDEDSVEFANSNFYFRNLYTIPVHNGIDFNQIDQIVDIVYEWKKAND